MCLNLDGKVEDDSNTAGGANYSAITALATRQAFGGTQLVGTEDDYYLLMKEISSDGNLNTVDVIFPSHPIFLYHNPDLLKRLLAPLLEYQESGLYPNSYAMHDMGSKYPNATGHPDGDDERMPLEESGDMIIMMLAYANYANDTDYLAQHYPIMTQWAEYLRNESLIPAFQISTDDFQGALA